MKKIGLSGQIAGLFVSSCLSVATTSSAASGTVYAKIVEHKAAYAPKPQRGPHIDVKVTPPEMRGKTGRVMIEVYNRGKEHIALITFDVTLKNNNGWNLTAPVKAEDLKPNMSGGQWVEVPKMQEKFPVITAAQMKNLRILTAEAKEVKMTAYMDLIKQ